MRYEITTFINEGEGRFDSFRTTDLLVPGPRLVVTADHAHEAADIAWAIGNRQATDDNGTRWPSHVRSLSAGDVIVTRTGPTEHVIAWAAERTGGVTPLLTYEVFNAVTFGEVSSRGRSGFGPEPVAPVEDPGDFYAGRSS